MNLLHRIPLLLSICAFATASFAQDRPGVTIIGPDTPVVAAPAASAAVVPEGTDPAATAPAETATLVSQVTSTVPEVVTCPIGSVVAWLGNYANTPALPKGWVECNGQTVQMDDSPYNGMTVPNLNGSGTNSQPRFLKGAIRSGAEGGSIDHTHGLILMDRASKNQVNVQARNPAPHLPPYYEVVWIMRIL